MVPNKNTILYGSGLMRVYVVKNEAPAILSDRCSVLKAWVQAIGAQAIGARLDGVRLDGALAYAAWR